MGSTTKQTQKHMMYVCMFTHIYRQTKLIFPIFNCVTPDSVSLANNHIILDELRKTTCSELS